MLLASLFNNPWSYNGIATDEGTQQGQNTAMAYNIHVRWPTINLSIHLFSGLLYTFVQIFRWIPTYSNRNKNTLISIHIYILTQIRRSIIFFNKDQILIFIIPEKETFNKLAPNLNTTPIFLNKVFLTTIARMTFRNFYDITIFPR